MSKRLSAAGEAALNAPPQRIGSSKIACSTNKWIEIALVSGSGHAIGGIAYCVVDADGGSHRGKLDEMGIARVENVAEGDCAISFPELRPGGTAAPGGTRSSGERHVFTAADWSVVQLEPVGENDNAPTAQGVASGSGAAQQPDEDWKLVRIEPVPHRES